jgi:1,4-alpha-glucan branching enzyme
MYSKGRRKRTIRFSVKPQGSPKKVAVAGDFSHWRPLVMRRQADGTFARTARVAGVTFEYKFLIDGQWQIDLDHSNWAVSPLGSVNSLGCSPNGEEPARRPQTRKGA